MGFDPGDYVHGFDAPEAGRLTDQAAALEAAFHGGIRYPEHSLVLEVGCGTGARTVALAQNNPGAQILAFDSSPVSLDAARARIAAAGLANVQFLEADLFSLPFPPASFDHVFICFVLEHLIEPVHALVQLRRFVRPGGTVSVIGGDHGTSLVHPESCKAHALISALANLQRAAGGDPHIGRRMHTLLSQSGWESVHVKPLQIYADGSCPELAEAFTRRTFIAMIEGVRARAVRQGLMSAYDFDQGLSDLRRAADPEGAFAYTFFKGRARAPLTPEELPCA